MLKPHGGQPVASAGAPLEECEGAVIMAHGRGASPASILDLVPRLNRPRFAYLAPAASGQTWYPYSFMAPRERNEPGLSSGLDVLDGLVRDLAARGIASHRVVLLGFSQGACLTSEFAMLHARRYGGVVAFSGGLIGPPGTTWSPAGSFAGTPIFLGCSDVDAHVPEHRVRETADVFERMGAAVTLRIFPGMGHLVNDDEIAAAQVILDSIR